MRRRLTSFLLMFCLILQGMAVAGTDVVFADDPELLHASMHWLGEAHHHDQHGHGELHQDESPASVQHLMADACTFAPALVHSVALRLPQLLPDGPGEATASAIPKPFLDGLERPPRLTA